MIGATFPVAAVLALTAGAAWAGDVERSETELVLTHAVEQEKPRIGLGEISRETADIAGPLMLAVQRCWVIDTASQAGKVVVTLAVELDRDGRVVPGSVSMLGASAGTGEAVEQAYAAARRAVMRCQSAGGYDLPPERHAEWKHIEMKFDPRSPDQR